jgi:predicted ATP-grasp superfamily ATP-dependent carboligase
VENVLVTDTELRTSLAVIRSLGKKNIEITAGSDMKSALGFYSKYTSKKFLYPNPRQDPQGFLKSLLDIVEKGHYNCIIPIHTYTMFLLTKYRTLFSKYTQIPPPGFKIFINAYDKKKLLNIAIKHGIACPETYLSDDIDQVEKNITSYPVIIKPARRHTVPLGVCHTTADLKTAYHEMCSKYGPCIVQEYIPNGGEFGVYTLFDDQSKPLALTVQKRIRCLNADGGISTLRETVKNEELVNIALRLLQTIKWSGVAMVEFRIDARDNIPKLMEINPRFWGSLPLSILSGPDFPYLLYNVIRRKDVSPMLDYKVGVRCRWLLGDIVRMIGGPHRLHACVDVLQTTGKTHYDNLSFGDPVPIIASIFSQWGSFDEGPRDDDPLLYNGDSSLKD